MFGKAKCRICGESVKLALKHLNNKHPEVLQGEKTREKLQKLIDKYFD